MYFVTRSVRRTHFWFLFTIKSPYFHLCQHLLVFLGEFGLLNDFQQHPHISMVCHNERLQAGRALANNERFQIPIVILQSANAYKEDIDEIKGVLAEIWRLQRLSLLKAL